MPVPDAISQLERDLRSIFGDRLSALVTYARQPPGPPATIAVVDRLGVEDLQSCATRVAGWHAAHIGTPLILPTSELTRSLDAFPIEFNSILASYQVVAGQDPFEALRVDPMHLRMACEVQVRSHLLHLREDYLETEGRGSSLAALMAESAHALAALVTSVAELDGAKAPAPEDAARHLEITLGLADAILVRVVTMRADRPPSSEDARKLWPDYLDAVEQLARHVDRWRSSQP